MEKGQFETWGKGVSEEEKKQLKETINKGEAPQDDSLEEELMVHQKIKEESEKEKHNLGLNKGLEFGNMLFDLKEESRKLNERLEEINDKMDELKNEYIILLEEAPSPENILVKASEYKKEAESIDKRLTYIRGLENKISKIFEEVDKEQKKRKGLIGNIKNTLDVLVSLKI